MTTATLRTLVLATLALVTACAGSESVTSARPEPPQLSHVPAHPAVRFSELHYDNTGTDVGEAIEVSFPWGTSLTGWSVVLYNGNGGAVYDTDALGALVQTQCGTRGVVVLQYPSNGIQNGSPDGIALVDQSGTLVEFLSYEGTFSGVGGAANGVLSSDIGVAQNGTEAAGSSLQRDGFGVWTASPGSNSFGACNDPDPPPAQPVASVVLSPASATIAVGGTQLFTATALDAGNQPVAGVSFTWSSDATGVATVNTGGLASGVGTGDATITATAGNGVFGTAQLHVNPAPPAGPVFFTEIHYDNSGTDTGEALELEGPAGSDLTGWSVVLYNGNGGASYNTRVLSGAIPNLCGGRGVIALSYPSNGVQNGNPDGFALVNPGGQVVEFLSYGGTFAATNGAALGMTSVDIGVAESGATPIGYSLKRHDDGNWYAPAPASFGTCNGPPTPPPANTIAFSGRSASDPALPAGFQDQLFATLLDGNGVAIPASFTWSSDTPALASVDAQGVVTALGAGTAILRATASDAGATTATVSLPTRIATASATALYAGNAEFGEPADGDLSDDLILRHAQYTTSFNPNRGTPNWVSYDLELSHFGSEDRCDCFTFDPALPAQVTRYTTAAYTGAGTFHGYGIDRGHLARSFDRTAGSLDNAFTFYFSNIIPQAADQNQGPWAALESYLGDLARFQNKEVYIIAGVAGSKGTVKNEGRIVIPASTWKVALILPRDQGLADVDDYLDPTVVAVIMPNDPGIRNVDWHSYETTVDAVEALSGYDLLALLPDQIEIAVESGTAPPNAAVNGPYTALPNEVIALSGAGSSDPDGDALSYQWSFGDGSGASGVAVSHAYAAPGEYTVRLIVTDPRGLVDTVFTTATILSPAQAVEQALDLVELLRGAGLAAGTVNSLAVKLEAALRQLGRGNAPAARGQLESLLHELDALVRAGRLGAGEAGPLGGLVERILAVLSG